MPVRTPRVLNNTDIGGLLDIDGFRVPARTSIGDGIEACSSWCGNHSSTCGGWVYVDGHFAPGSRYNGPRCQPKGLVGVCVEQPKPGALRPRRPWWGNRLRHRQDGRLSGVLRCMF